MKTKLITRAVDQTTVEVMTVDVVTCDVCILTYTFTGIYTQNKLYKMCSAKDTDVLKHIYIVSETVTQKLYGMKDSDFLSLAHELDSKRNIKK